MEKTIIERDNTMTVEQQIALLTRRIAILEQVVSEMSGPVTWQEIEAAGQFA